MIEMRKRHRLERRRQLLDQAAGALIRLLRAFREHRAAVLVDDLDVEALLGLLDHDVLRDFGDLGHLLHAPAATRRRRAQRRDRPRTWRRRLLPAALVGGRRGRRILGRNWRGVLELRPGRQAGDFDDAGVAHAILHAEGIAHRAGDDLQLHLVLGRERDQHHEERDQQAHQVGEGHEPAVTAAVCPPRFLLRHAVSNPFWSTPTLPSSRHRLGSLSW